MPDPAPARNDAEQELHRRMLAHELYTDNGPGLTEPERRRRARDLVHDFNTSRPSQADERDVILREVFAHVGQDLWIEPPLHIAYGYNVSFGDGVYLNSGANFVDDVAVSIGSRVMFGPNVVVTTTGHPVHPQLRRDGSQFSAPVTIGDDVWIGAGAVVLPGVTIGAGSVVAAGSVVTKTVPPLVVVAGVPARIIREITDEDRDFHYRAPGNLTP